MKTQYNTNNEFKELDELNKTLYIPYKKSREEVWELLRKDLNKTEPKVIRAKFNSKTIGWIAASILLLIGSAFFARFFHFSVKSNSGEMTNVILPDGSEVNLAAKSVLTYYPLWWGISREVTLEGEAFFKVIKGKRFLVTSKQGVTSVKGTSFDIYARHNNYRVVCYTGKVVVRSLSSINSIVLTQGEKAELDQLGNLLFSKETNLSSFVAWMKNEFVFTAADLSFVLQEIGRRYNVTITLNKHVDGTYTGNFPASIPVEKALQIVCKPFGLNVVKKTGHYFVIN